MQKKCKNCGHSEFWHNKVGCNHEEEIVGHTTSGVIGLPYHRIIYCECKKFEC